MVTLVSPRMLQTRWFWKLNGAEWSSEANVQYTNTWKEQGSHFDAYFSPARLNDWTPSAHLLPNLLSRQVPGWIGHHLHGDWGDDTCACTHTDTHTQSHRLENETGFMSELPLSLARWKVVSPKGRQKRGLSCHSKGTLLSSFIPLCENGRISFCFSFCQM